MAEIKIQFSFFLPKTIRKQKTKKMILKQNINQIRNFPAEKYLLYK